MCSGAAAAAAAAASSSSLSSGEGGKRRALFCDPDQVLDRETLLSVALKLREFADSFPLSTMDITEGMEFGDVGVCSSVSGGGGSDTTTVGSWLLRRQWEGYSPPSPPLRGK